MSLISRLLNRRKRQSDTAGDRPRSTTPWVVATGMVLFALLGASCMETTTQSRAVKGDGSPDGLAWNPRAATGSEWTIDDVEGEARGWTMGLSPALTIAGRTIVDFFAPDRFQAPDSIRASSGQPLTLTQTTTVVAAPPETQATVAAITAPMIVSINNPGTSRTGMLAKSSKQNAAAKMSEAQTAAYLESLNVCQPPFPAGAVAIIPSTPLSPSNDIGSSPLVAVESPAQPRPQAEVPPAATVVATAPLAPPVTPEPVAATPMAPINIPAERPVWTGLLGLALGVAAFGAAFLTLGLAYAHARTTDRNGRPRRSLTLRARLTLGFGAMATLGLTACALAAAMMVGSVSGAVQIAACAVVSIVAPIGLWMWLYSAFVEPIAQASEAVAAIATGDLLRAPLNSTTRDECGELCRGIDRLAATVRDALTEVAISTTAVSGAANQIASGSQRMADSVGSVMQKCSDAATTASDASLAVVEGQAALRDTADDIRCVNKIASNQTQGAQAILNGADRTAKLVQLIEDLADRSHLVALNASVEASRSGAASGPFGQLAEEARRVAERAQSAVAEASRTVESLDAEAHVVREQATQTSIHARHGAGQAETANNDLARIVGRTHEVAGATRAAATTAREAGADAVQSAAIAAQLASRASDIMAVLGRFKLGTEKLIRQAPANSVATPADRP